MPTCHLKTRYPLRVELALRVKGSNLVIASEAGRNAQAGATGGEGM